MTTPVLEELHKRYPEYLIDIVADQKSDELYTNCPYRGDIFYKNKSLFLRGGLDLFFKLFGRRYALALDLRTDGFLYLIRCDERITKRKYPGQVHAVEHYLDHLDIRPKTFGQPPTKIWVTPEDTRIIDILGFDHGDKILALGPGANFPGKIWRHHNFVQMINSLSGQFNKIILLGSSNDRALAETIVNAVSAEVQNLCGKTRLLEAAAIMARSSLFIGNDSGLGHIAAAMQTPTITVFGPGNPQRYQPWGLNSEIVCADSRIIDDVSCEQVLSIARKLSVHREHM